MDLSTNELLCVPLFLTVVLGQEHVRIGLVFKANVSSRHGGWFESLANWTIHKRNISGDYLNFAISYDTRETSNVCKTGIRSGVGILHELHVDSGIHVLIGHTCSKDMEGIGDLGAYLKVPVLTSGASGTEFDDKSRFTSLTRTSCSTSTIANVVLKLSERYNWSHWGLISENNHDYKYNIKNGLPSSNITLTVKTALHNDSRTPRDALEKVTKESRIIILDLSCEYLRKVLIAAHNMRLTDGNYVFMNIDPYGKCFGNESWMQGDQYDEDAKEAYQALLTMKLYEPDTSEYLNFIKRAEQIKFMTDSQGLPEDKKFVVSALLDAVILFSLAVNETLAEGGDITDGYSLTPKMWDRRFEGISGNVIINSNGDRVADYELLDMTDTENGTFHAIFHYYGASGELNKTKNKPAWPGGRTEAPPDVPPCGFWNEKPGCGEEDHWKGFILIPVAVTFLCTILLSGLILYSIGRRKALNAELMKMCWIIKWSDLVFDQENQTMLSHSASMLQRELSSSARTEYVRRSNERIAEYQGRLVLVKKINQNKVDLIRDVLIELRNMKLLDHTNVVRFIGACVEDSNVATIQEYCSKGSLEDILHNDDLKLDWTFKCSLINDVIQGLHYIHSSDIGVHGYLTSETCLVDSRFVLKLGFHGLHLFRKDEKIVDGLSNKAAYRKLWASPELLRSDGKSPTKESDIYSAGIILAEIITRLEPYKNERDTFDITEILKRVKDGESPPFRQVIPEDEASPQVVLLIQKCTEEEPEMRPTTAVMMTTMRKVNKDIKGGANLLDNLLARMEQYATNLEKLVEERTAAFLEEKKKAERLLYELLPKTVAEQLKCGDCVQPEYYDSVTIFFSDIVGFTAMSAQSTPMQVVAFLNDLYTCFDGILSSFDVYKVETIGDAYMVVSGLPIRNGDAHAREIANMSLVLIEASVNFTIRHLPDRKLLLRVGIHSGSCVAGVVGLKMPRYCLFGDTVNTGSRMESNGEALKIHISQSTQDILMKLGGFQTEYRGEIELKGKGVQKTYWLLSSDSKPEKRVDQTAVDIAGLDVTDIHPAKLLNIKEIVYESQC